MSTQDVQDAAVRNWSETVSTAAHDAQQQARDRISPARPTVCGVWIVARDQANLYESLQYAYRDSEKITVFLDRRQGERRQAAQSVPEERRRGDRRHLPSLAHDLRLWEYVFVRPYPRKSHD
jgi:hypothetical protein